jgi:hypothetical protein
LREKYGLEDIFTKQNQIFFENTLSRQSLLYRAEFMHYSATAVGLILHIAFCQSLTMFVAFSAAYCKLLDLYLGFDNCFG